MFFEYVAPSGEPLPPNSASGQGGPSPEPGPKPGQGVLFRVLELQLPDGTKQTIIDDVNKVLVKPLSGVQEVDEDFTANHLTKVTAAIVGTWGSQRRPYPF